MAAILDSERRNALTEAINCYAVSYLFRQRRIHLRKRILALKFSGFLGVFLVGLVVLAAPNSGEWQGAVIGLAILINSIHLIFSLWSLVSGWDDCCHYYASSVSENEWLSVEFHKLYLDESRSVVNWRQKLSEYEAISSRRGSSDNEREIDDQGKSLGYCAALLQYNQSCGKCGKIPENMNPTSCPSCGGFNQKRRQ